MSKTEENNDPPLKKKLKKQYVKKNYIDPTAGFAYMLGYSLLHFSLMILCLVVERGNT